MFNCLRVTGRMDGCSVCPTVGPVGVSVASGEQNDDDYGSDFFDLGAGIESARGGFGKEEEKISPLFRCS